ncbi:hypothetical protein [Mucilaginibacter segetis]|uniref:Uncharacterized protein n=1 Tax=Mucilaginibacter segetis TaxID=2793071 RepID=A0A934PQD0_9SPHI|nr:hypothetical protein [Mucilaginibacter segetis]MBK0378829.1 hypothetical protein [Mucilaginibacter segetis]
MANLKIVILLLLVSFLIKNADAQNSKVYYDYPETVNLKLDEHIDSYLTLYKKLDTNVRVYLVVSQYRDTTYLLVTKFNIKDSPFNFILNNTNRFYKVHLKNKTFDIPVIPETDFYQSELLNKKEVINGKNAATKIHIFRSGYLIGFTNQRNKVLIVADKLITE